MQRAQCQAKEETFLLLKTQFEQEALKLISGVADTAPLVLFVHSTIVQLQE